ncbi:hypothetical protein LCGC14_1415930, partial [marine sediment metagenome]
DYPNKLGVEVAIKNRDLINNIEKEKFAKFDLLKTKVSEILELLKDENLVAFNKLIGDWTTLKTDFDSSYNQIKEKLLLMKVL